MTVGGGSDNEELSGALHTYQAIEKQTRIHSMYLLVGRGHGAVAKDGDWRPLFHQKQAAYYRAKIDFLLDHLGQGRYLHHQGSEPFRNRSPRMAVVRKYEPCRPETHCTNGNGGLSFRPMRPRDAEVCHGSMTRRIPSLTPEGTRIPREFMTEISVASRTVPSNGLPTSH